MNTDQIMSIVRTLGKLAGGGVVGAVLAHNGWMPEDITSLQGALTTIVGGVAAIVAIIASHKSNATPPAIK